MKTIIKYSSTATKIKTKDGIKKGVTFFSQLFYVIDGKEYILKHINSDNKDYCFNRANELKEKFDNFTPSDKKGLVSSYSYKRGLEIGNFYGILTESEKKRLHSFYNGASDTCINTLTKLE